VTPRWALRESAHTINGLDLARRWHAMLSDDVTCRIHAERVVRCRKRAQRSVTMSGAAT